LASEPSQFSQVLKASVLFGGFTA